MKKFKVVEELTHEQEMCDDFIKASEVTSMRIAIHDNNQKEPTEYKKNRWVAEVDLFFQDGSDLKLRQNLGTWRNHCYKVPKLSGDLDFNEWYEHVYAKAKNLDSTRTAVHGKLGMRMRNPDNAKQKKYFNVPGIFITYDYDKNMATLFMTEPMLNTDNTIDYWTENFEMEVELTKNSLYDNNQKKLHWVNIEGDE